MTDPRSIAALDVSERFANCNATQEELDAAWAAASDAARAASAAAWAAAWAARAAWAAARDARDAASDAAWADQEKRLRELCAEVALSEVSK